MQTERLSYISLYTFIYLCPILVLCSIRVYALGLYWCHIQCRESTGRLHGS